MTKKVIVFAALVAACLGSFGQSQGNCQWCDRTVAVKAISLTNPWFTDEIATAWLAPILSSSCVNVKAFGGEPRPEYILVVRFESNIHGKFPNLDGTYSDPGEVRGAGSILTIVLFGAFGKKEPWKEFGAFGREVPDYGCFLESARTEDKGFSWEPHKSLMLAQLGKIIPLEKYLRDWENTPVKVQIQPQQEDLFPGQEISIRVKDLRDKSGKPMNIVCNPNRVLIKAQKGEVLNTELPIGTLEDPRLMAYPLHLIVGKGEIVIHYKAPNDRCSEDTITVYNSCDILDTDFLPLEQTHKKDQIGVRKLRVGCDRWDFTITYLEDVTVNQNEDGNLTQAARNYRMTLSGRLEFKEQHPEYIEFTADSAVLELSDTLDQHRTFAGEPPQNIQAGYSGQGRGEGFASVWLHIPRLEREPIQFGWSNLKKPVSYKGTCQWWGWSPIPDGAAEFSAQTLMALNNDNATDQIPEEALKYKQGQAVLSGEYSWQDMGTLVGAGGPFMLPFEDEEIQWTKQPPVGAISLATPMSAASAYRHTIKWEFRKGGK
jgi:hypothetical protein